MKRFKIKQSTADIVSQSGLALIRQAINRYTTLTQELDTQVPLHHGIKHSDVVKSYLGLVSAGKNCPASVGIGFFLDLSEYSLVEDNMTQQIRRKFTP